MSLTRALTRPLAPGLTRNLDRSVGAGGAVDADFSSVSLLLPMDDDVYGHTHDLSNSDHLCSVEGAATSQATGKFGGAGDFGSSHDVRAHISVPDHADFEFGTGDFTIECWVQYDIIPSDGGGRNMVFAAKYGAAGARSWRFWVASGRTVAFTASADGTTQATALASAAQTLVAGTWYHMAVARASNVVKMFMDGTEIDSSDEGSVDYHNNATPVTIGEATESGVELPFTGNIDGVRITKGVARYTGAFTAPEAAYPTENAAPTDSDFDSVVLLLNFAGADTATDITDLSNSAHTETFAGNAQVDDDILSLNQNTLLLDGDGDYITFPDHADWDLPGDFTIEFTVRVSADAKTGVFLSNYDTPNGWSIQNLGGTALRLLEGDTMLKSETWDPTEDQEYHVAITRVSGSIRFWIDGTELGTATSDSSSITSTAALAVGALPVPGQYAWGNMGAVRITKGVGRYTEAFTAPTEFYPTS